MAVLDRILGALLVGSYVNLLLYTLEGVAVIKYYSITKHKKDSRLVRTMVYATFMVDTVSTMAMCAAIYLYTVTHWGDVSYLQTIHWPSTLVVATIGVTEPVVQCFLIYRYWKLTGTIYVTFVLTLLMLAAFGGGMANFVIVLRLATSSSDQFGQRSQLKLASIIWFSTSVAADISISLALLYQLSRIKSPFKSTQSLVHKLMATTLSTGTLPSVIVTISTVVFLTDGQSNVASIFAYASARCYALSMFYVLNNRSSLTGGSMTTGDLARSLDITMNTANGVYVQRTATTVRHGHSNDHELELSNRSKDESEFLAGKGKVTLLQI